MVAARPPVGRRGHKRDGSFFFCCLSVGIFWCMILYLGVDGFRCLLYVR